MAVENGERLAQQLEKALRASGVLTFLQKQGSDPSNTRSHVRI